MSKPIGRPARETPRELFPDWPDTPVPDPVFEKLRQLTLNLRYVILESPMRGRGSVRSFAAEIDMNHAILQKALRGDSILDSMTIARLEVELGISLWPSPNELGFGDLE
ncbi:hypothetical protein [Corynebacterium marinum]|uniref:XRE family transcriptional regulator n=1 Tax=Corynebacterium marinum DSM 44953 TaxID=1224162 RepID=A0A0B6TV21_9CORY|nr:hypothetical protein [Corynebacterium marinum]AJK68596.1 hypothetical protein B840_04885 [Corynebacterium marinum DSM 44953]GGO14451.1 hypothetical protein GCM10010980_08860 [Corynebacterium marinum]